MKKFALMMAGALMAVPMLVQASVPSSPPARPQNQLEKAVRHELLMLPYYNIFDDLSFRVDGDHVTLMGEVTRPTLKSNAGNVIKRLEGVHSVTNNIEVLPLSPMDNQIRFATMRAIYGYPSLQRYALGALPPIHIIVKNGNVTLTGVVANEADKNVAYIRAMGVFGVFSVKNELSVERHS
jgi:hyperosmotically inducible protein